MIRMIKPAVPGKDKIGDILYGGDYLAEVFENPEVLVGKKVVRLGRISTNHWVALDKLGIVGARKTARELEYDCPWTTNRFYWWYPILLITKEEGSAYKKTLTWNCDVRCAVGHDDTSLHELGLNKICSPIDDVMMGHGYTPMTLPTDGHGRRAYAAVELSNGETLVVSCWVWFNK